MDFHDFPRFLGKSGAVLRQPPKLCASLISSIRGMSAVVGPEGRTGKALRALHHRHRTCGCEQRSEWRALQPLLQPAPPPQRRVVDLPVQTCVHAAGTSLASNHAPPGRPQESRRGGLLPPFRRNIFVLDVCSWLSTTQRCGFASFVPVVPPAHTLPWLLLLLLLHRLL